MSSVSPTGMMMPEQVVAVPRPSWSKPEEKRLYKDNFFKELYCCPHNLFYCLTWAMFSINSASLIVLFTQNVQFCWVGKKCLLAIDDQGKCCCCWSFTSTEAITAAHAIKNKREMVILSKQQLIDCMYTRYEKPSFFAKLTDNQCFPCTYNKGYRFAKDYGIVVETEYPYMAKRGECQCQPKMRAIKIGGHMIVTEMIKELEKKTGKEVDEKQLIERLIKQQPISCMAFHVPSLQYHRGKGVYMGLTEDEKEQIRKKELEGESIGKHSMLIIGYR